MLKELNEKNLAYQALTFKYNDLNRDFMKYLKDSLNGMVEIGSEVILNRIEDLNKQNDLLREENIKLREAKEDALKEFKFILDSNQEFIDQRRAYEDKIVNLEINCNKLKEENSSIIEIKKILDQLKNDNFGLIEENNSLKKNYENLILEFSNAKQSSEEIFSMYNNLNRVFLEKGTYFKFIKIRK